MDCGYNCHEKCIESVPKNCTRFKSVRESGVSIQTSTKPTSLDTTSVGSGEIYLLISYVLSYKILKHAAYTGHNYGRERVCSIHVQQATTKVKSLTE